MSPAFKYTLGRVVIFVIFLAVLTPIPLNLLVKLMIALFASAGFSYFLLAKWRNQMAEQLGAAADRRRRERTRLRAALAGDDAAVAAGDRAAEPTAPTAEPAREEAAPTTDTTANARTGDKTDVKADARVDARTGDQTDAKADARVDARADAQDESK